MPLSKAEKARRYGGEFRRVREMWRKQIDAGETPVCRRCGKRIEAGAEWDLDHLEGGGLWPSHRACNRGTAGIWKRKAAARPCPCGRSYAWFDCPPGEYTHG